MINRERMSQPSGRPAGFQNWLNLAFVHWRVPTDVLRRVVPEPLAIDTWQNEAWLGLVAFDMSGIRPWWSPPLPYLCAFPETNLRTYVHLGGADPGVWFFSLDASRWLAVQAARWGWGLNYCWSRMHVRRSYDGGDTLKTANMKSATIPSRIDYFSRRFRGPQARTRLSLQVASDQPPRHAEVGSLEYFLCERYLLYTLHRGRPFTARVHHEPYPLVDAELMVCEQSLTETIGCRVAQADHVIFSPGVQVRVYPLQPARAGDEALLQ